MSFAIFLDIDGVLNTRTTVERTPEGYRGIDGARVVILANAIKQYGGAEIILSSDWKTIREESEDIAYLESRLAEQGLKLAGKTIEHRNQRGEGINNYLKEHPEIDEFVILDDNTFDFADYNNLWERLLLTNGIERAECASKTPAIEAILFWDFIKQFS